MPSSRTKKMHSGIQSLEIGYVDRNEIKVGVNNMYHAVTHIIARSVGLANAQDPRSILDEP